MIKSMILKLIELLKQIIQIYEFLCEHNASENTSFKIPLLDHNGLYKLRFQFPHQLA